MKRIEISLLALAAAVLPAAGQAQQGDTLERIVLSAGLEATAADRTGATVIVITGQELQAAGDVRLIDYLARVVGFSIRTRGPIGTQTGFTLRGASQNYVAVLVDGINVSDPSGTQVSFDFGSLSTADISRVEILKGSQSALYGSQAVGGVINITTRRATQDGIQHSLEVEGGSYATARLSYGFAARSARHEFAATLAHLRTDGFSAADENDGNTEADGFESTRLSFSASTELDSGLRLGASGFYEDSFGHFDEGAGAGGDGTPGDETNDNRSYGLRVFAEFSTARVDHTLAASYFDIDRDVRGSWPGVFNGQREGVSYQGATDLGAVSRLGFGADTVKETSDGGDATGKNRQSGVFAELTHAATDRLDLSAVLRHDDHSRFGGHATGRAALAWRLQDDLILRASMGSGFRAPSNYELFHPYFGDPDLQPEESQSADLGIEKRYGDRASIRATLFYLDVDNLIFWDDRGTDAWEDDGYAQAPGLSRRSGLELEAAFPLGARVGGTLAYTYTDSATNAASSWARVPRHMLALSLAAELAPRLTAVATLEHGADRATLPDYTVVNTSLGYDLGNGAQAWLRIENLFDAQYQYVKGYGTSDRVFYAGLRKNF